MLAQWVRHLPFIVMPSPTSFHSNADGQGLEGESACTYLKKRTRKKKKECSLNEFMGGTVELNESGSYDWMDLKWE